MLRYRVGLPASIAFVFVLTPLAPAQVRSAAGDEAAVHRMELWNGSTRASAYYSQGVSPGEEATLRELERSENDLVTAGQIVDLRRLYVRNERLLEQRRGQVNPLLYGYSSEYGAGLFPGTVVRNLGYAGYPYGIGGLGGFASGVVYPGYSASLGTVANSLAAGIGDEGVIKDVLARSLLDPAASDAYARAARSYDAAMTRVAGSPRLAGAFNKSHMTLVAETRHEVPISVTTKDGKTFDGNLVREEPDWLVVETAKGEEVRIPKSEVKLDVRKKSLVKPAGQ